MLSASFCVHVFCLSVNPRAHLRNHQIFAHVALVALQYVVYFRFRGRCHVFIQTVDKAAQQNGTHTQRDLTGAEWIWQRSIHFKRTISASSMSDRYVQTWRHSQTWTRKIGEIQTCDCWDTFADRQTDRQTDTFIIRAKAFARDYVITGVGLFIYIYCYHDN